MRRALIALAVAVASWADVTATAQSTQAPSTAPADSPAGPAAYSCGNPTSPPQTPGRGGADGADLQRRHVGPEVVGNR